MIERVKFYLNRDMKHYVLKKLLSLSQIFEFLFYPNDLKIKYKN